MAVRVEFYGIPRQRAGVEATDVEADDLGGLFEQLSARFPGLAEACLQHRRLQRGYLANINGRSFTSDPSQPLSDGDCVMILSADAGG